MFRFQLTLRTVIFRDCGHKQYDRLENQRGRLLDELEKQERLKDKILLERMILDIDVRISELALKIGPTKISKPENPETEKQIREIVRKITLNPVFSLGLSKDKIIFEIIRITKYNQSRAKKNFHEMIELGLGADRVWMILLMMSMIFCHLLS